MTTTCPVSTIKQLVADWFNIPVTEMDRRNRRPHVAWPRQIAMFITREVTELTYNQIGNAFANRDHGTVMHACDLVNSRASFDQRDGEVITQLTLAAKWRIRPSTQQYWII